MMIEKLHSFIMGQRDLSINKGQISQKMFRPLGPDEWNKSIIGQTKMDNLASIIQNKVYPEWIEPILDNTHPGDHVLELGSGTGEMSAILALQGRNVSLMDYSQKSLDFSKGLFQILGLLGEFTYGDVSTRFPFDDNNFDVVWSSGLLEHFSDEEIVHILAESNRISRKTIISLVPNANSIAYRLGKWNQERAGKWIWGYEDPKSTLVNFYNKVGIRNIEEYSVAIMHSLSFLNSRQLMPVSKALTEFYQGLTVKELAELNQGYLLATVGKKEQNNNMEESLFVIS